jgi:hypothetical protein
VTKSSNSKLIKTDAPSKKKKPKKEPKQRFKNSDLPAVVNHRTYRKSFIPEAYLLLANHDDIWLEQPTKFFPQLQALVDKHWPGADIKLVPNQPFLELVSACSIYSLQIG